MTGDHYAEGVRIAGTLKDLDGPNVNRLCHTRLYTHGRRTERALVLLHGFTSCPEQLHELGCEFFDLGWNVLIPRYPRHGYSDRLNTSIAELRADHLAALANRAAEAGAGLGERLTVAGLSLGATLAGWVAQTRDDIDRVVLAGLHPTSRTRGRVAALLPNFYLWWDRRLKDDFEPKYAYPRVATRAYAALADTERRLLTAARRDPPRAKHIAVVTEAGEPRLLIESWRAHGANVETRESPYSAALMARLIEGAAS